MPSTSLVVSRTWGGPRGYIEPGPHTLQVRSKTHFSKERPFEVAEGHSVSFEAHEPRAGLTVIRALFNPELWITLKQD